MEPKVGRPTIITQDVLNKLEEVFALGGTDKEACLYANISHQTLYNYQDKNPEFVERKEALKETPLLKARRTVEKSLENDVNSAWKYVERKDKELHPQQKVDVTSNGETVIFSHDQALAIAKDLVQGTDTVGSQKG